MIKVIYLKGENGVIHVKRGHKYLRDMSNDELIRFSFGFGRK